MLFNTVWGVDIWDSTHFVKDGDRFSNLAPKCHSYLGISKTQTRIDNFFFILPLHTSFPPTANNQDYSKTSWVRTRVVRSMEQRLWNQSSIEVLGPGSVMWPHGGSLNSLLILKMGIIISPPPFVVRIKYVKYLV